MFFFCNEVPYTRLFCSFGNKVPEFSSCLGLCFSQYVFSVAWRQTKNLPGWPQDSKRFYALTWRQTKALVFLWLEGWQDSQLLQDVRWAPQYPWVVTGRRQHVKAGCGSVARRGSCEAQHETSCCGGVRIVLLRDVPPPVYVSTGTCLGLPAASPSVTCVSAW